MPASFYLHVDTICSTRNLLVSYHPPLRILPPHSIPPCPFLPFAHLSAFSLLPLPSAPHPVPHPFTTPTLSGSEMHPQLLPLRPVCCLSHPAAPLPSWPHSVPFSPRFLKVPVAWRFTLIPSQIRSLCRAALPVCSSHSLRSGCPSCHDVPFMILVPSSAPLPLCLSKTSSSHPHLQTSCKRETDATCISHSRS